MQILINVYISELSSYPPPYYTLFCTLLTCYILEIGLCLDIKDILIWLTSLYT